MMEHVTNYRVYALFWLSSLEGWDCALHAKPILLTRRHHTPNISIILLKKATSCLIWERKERQRFAYRAPSPWKEPESGAASLPCRSPPRQRRAAWARCHQKGLRDSQGGGSPERAAPAPLPSKATDKHTAGAAAQSRARGADLEGPPPYPSPGDGGSLCAGAHVEARSCTVGGKKGASLRARGSRPRAPCPAPPGAGKRRPPARPGSASTAQPPPGLPSLPAAVPRVRLHVRLGHSAALAIASQIQ